MMTNTTTKLNGLSRAGTRALGRPPLAAPWPTPAWTMEEQLQRIEAMGQQINGYIQFMCKIGSWNGTSAEAREGAVAAFYDRLLVMERQLAKIQEDLQLG